MGCGGSCYWFTGKGPIPRCGGPSMCSLKSFASGAALNYGQCAQCHGPLTANHQCGNERLIF